MYNHQHSKSNYIIIYLFHLNSYFLRGFVFVFKKSNSLPNCRLLRFYVSFVQDFCVSFLFVFFKFKNTAELSPFKIICGLLFTFSFTAEMTHFFLIMFTAEMSHCRIVALPKCLLPK